MADPDRHHLLRVAHELADRGMHVFPLRAGTKRPALEQDWRGLATTDPATITSWWQDGGAHNIGVATGTSRLVVIDLDDPTHGRRRDPDRPHGRVALAALARSVGAAVPADTFTVNTARGGQHLYFKAPPDIDLPNSVGRLGPHIDTRGIGGYVVGPESIVAGRRYRVVVAADPLPLPSWIVDALRPRTHAPAAGAAREHPRQLGPYVRAAVRGELHRVRTAEVGRRNQALFTASARLARFVASGQISEDEIRAALIVASDGHLGVEGFTAAEARRTVESGLRHGAHRYIGSNAAAASAPPQQAR